MGCIDSLHLVPDLRDNNDTETHSIIVIGASRNDTKNQTENIFHKNLGLTMKYTPSQFIIKYMYTFIYLNKITMCLLYSVLVSKQVFGHQCYLISQITFLALNNKIENGEILGQTYFYIFATLVLHFCPLLSCLSSHTMY